jgi:hypothetical protein
MSAHPHAGPPHGNLDNPDTTHESSDINVRAIISFTVVLTIIVLVIDLAMYGLFRVLHNYEVRNDPYVTPLATPLETVPKQPEPALQTEPWVDLKKFRTDQDAHMTSYGWVDEKTGVARIPIARAKELLLKRGIPVRPELADPTLGINRAATGESSGGRNLPTGTPVAPAAAAAPAPAPHEGHATPPVKPGGGGQ